MPRVKFLCMTHDIVSVTIRCHCVDFDLVLYMFFCFNLLPKYVYVIQFCPNFFNN